MQSKNLERRSARGVTGAAGFNVWAVSINLLLLSINLVIGIRAVLS